MTIEEPVILLTVAYFGMQDEQSPCVKPEGQYTENVS